MNRKIIALWSMIVLTLIFIWGNSFLSREISSEMSGIVARFLSALEITEFYVRKLAHFFEFFALGIEFSVLVVISRKADSKWVIFALFLGLIIGLMDETIQKFTGRGSSVIDVWLDWAGYNFGFWTYRLVSSIYNF